MKIPIFISERAKKIFTNIFMNFTHIKDHLKKNVSTKTVWIAGGTLVGALVIFQAGIFVGYHKASFSYRSGDNFHMMFGSPERRTGIEPGRMMGFPEGEFTSAYGANGTIIKIDLPTIIIAGADNVEKIIVVNDKTILRHYRNDIGNKDLKVGDSIIVIGSPNASSTQIEAKLIRVLPPLSITAATSTN